MTPFPLYQTTCFFIPLVAPCTPMLVALDTPGALKEQNGNHSIVIDYLYQGKRAKQTIEAPELKAGIPFAYDEIISVHSHEPTLEDIFIRYTGRRLF